MPRDSSGNYTLPAGNPVTPDTLIDVAWANPTMSDVAAQFNDVITRDGLLGAAAPISFASGSTTRPGIYFGTKVDSGFYAVSDGIGISYNGLAALKVSAAGTEVFGALRSPTTAVSENSTKVATTAFVHSAIAGDTGPNIAMFLAYAATSQTIPTPGVHLLRFDSVVYDTNLVYDPSSSRFTCKEAGTYVFSAGVSIPGEFELMLYLDGSLVTVLQYFTGVTAGNTSGSSPPLQLSVGAYVEVFITVNQQYNTVAQLPNTFFSAFQVGARGATGQPGTAGSVGPQGPTGAIGPPGLNGSSTVIVGSFGNVRLPTDLPSSGYIPKDWDGTGEPLVGYQVSVGQSMYYTGPSGSGYAPEDIFLFEGTASATPWLNMGNLKGAMDGTVKSVYVGSANGFVATVTDPTIHPSISLATSVAGLMAGNSGALAAAVSGLDIKTINGNSLIGAGNVVAGGMVQGDPLGTPASGNLVNCDGLPLGTGITGLGTGVATFLGTPTSANLALAITDNTGTGLAMFNGNPTITNFVETTYAPAAGAAFTVNLTNGTLQKFITNANATITLPAALAGKNYTIEVEYGGAHTVTWAGGTALRWSGGGAPSTTGVTGKVDTFTFYSTTNTATFGVSGGSNA